MAKKKKVKTRKLGSTTSGRGLLDPVTLTPIMPKPKKAKPTKKTAKK